MSRNKPLQLALLLPAILMTGCGIPDEVNDLMDSELDNQSYQSFSLTTEEIEQVRGEIAGKEQPPPL